jgi:hypothetical protein
VRGQQNHTATAHGPIPLLAIAALQEGDLVGAVRLTREAGGRGLKDSKDAVDSCLAANPQLREQFKAAACQRARPMRTLLKFGLLALAVALVLRALGK